MTLTVDSGNDRAIWVYDNLGFNLTDHLRIEASMRLLLVDPIVHEERLPPAERD